MRRILPLSILFPMAVLGCTAADIDAPAAPSIASGAGPAPVRSAPPDVGGEWTWSNVETLKMPEFIAKAVGVEPEGKFTHARCETTGSMTLFQTGATFSGTARRSFNECRTQGGEPFRQPETAFTVTDGRIQGHTLQFSINSPTVSPCPHKAVMEAIDGNRVTALSGTGHCILPGHPQSESPIAADPPGDTTKTLSWTAVRP